MWLFFFSVCYKESSAEQLEAFCEEVRDDGRMTEDTQAMFSQLEKTNQETQQSTEKVGYLPYISKCFYSFTYFIEYFPYMATANIILERNWAECRENP